MKYSQLITLTEQMIQSYNENIMTPDSHAEQFLSKQEKMQDTERVFLKQVFYGVDRYREFLRAFNRVLFQLYPAQAARTDSTLYCIFTYIICFRLDELPMQEFRKIVLSQNAVKMNVLFDLLFDLKKLRENVRPEWSKCLDEQYVDEQIIAKMEKKLEVLAELIAQVCERATGKKSDLVMSIESTVGMEAAVYTKKDSKKQPTTFEPFNLTKPKVKLLPEPDKIEVAVKARPAPNPGKSAKEIEQDKNRRRDEIRENVRKFYEENQKEFQLKSVVRPTNINKVKEEVEATLKKDFQPNRKFAKPMPKYGEVETKLNVAAILREQKKLKQKIEQEERRVKELEVNLRDDTQYQNWQKDMKDKDKYEQLQNQQRKKIEMELAREAAIKAYQDKVNENKQLVQNMKDIADELREQREELEAEERQAKRRLVEDVNEKKQNIVVEREKVVQKNKKAHDDGKEQMKRIIEKKKEEDAVEMVKKKELIREIRQLQKQQKVKPKVLNPTETMGFGLLQEMSLQELRERLVEAQQTKRREQQQRRAENMKKKDQFARSISQKKDMIMNNRAEQSRIKEEERLRKKREVEEERQRIEQVKLKSAQEFKERELQKQQQKRDDQEKLNKELKEISQRRQFMNENQAAVEANAFKNQQFGAERQLLDRQNSKLVDREKQESVKMKDMKVIADQAKKQIQEKIDFNKLYNENRQESNKVNQMIKLEDHEAKATRFHAVKEYEHKHSQNMTQLNEYKSKISEMSLTRAKASLARQTKK